MGPFQDKTALEVARKKIEVEMERFKEFERDAKTKTFSKEWFLDLRTGSAAFTGPGLP